MFHAERLSRLALPRHNRPGSCCRPPHRSDAPIVAHRSSFNGMPLADWQDQGVTSMQAGFLVAPQAPVATQPRQMVQPLPTGTERTPVAVPQFDVALANAMHEQGVCGSGNGSGGAIRCERSGRVPDADSSRDRDTQPPRQCRCLDCRLRRSIHPLERAGRGSNRQSAVPEIRVAPDRPWPAAGDHGDASPALEPRGGRDADQRTPAVAVEQPGDGGHNREAARLRAGQWQMAPRNLVDIAATDVPIAKGMLLP